MRKFHAFTVGNKVITTANEQRLHAGLALDFFCQPARDRQHNIFLANSMGPGRAGIITSVAGIDRNNEITGTIGRRLWRKPDDRRRMQRP